MPVDPALYERMVAVAIGAILPQIDINVIREVGWDALVTDVFNLADALTEEMQRRMART
jgi:hypothetical protein